MTFVKIWRSLLIIWWTKHFQELLARENEGLEHGDEKLDPETKENEKVILSITLKFFFIKKTYRLSLFGFQFFGHWGFAITGTLSILQQLTIYVDWEEVKAEDEQDGEGLGKLGPFFEFEVITKDEVETTFYQNWNDLIWYAPAQVIDKMTGIPRKCKALKEKTWTALKTLLLLIESHHVVNPHFNKYIFDASFNLKQAKLGKNLRHWNIKQELAGLLFWEDFWKVKEQKTVFGKKKKKMAV